jgi:hypothetical protein
MPKMSESDAFQRLGQFPHCDHRLLHSPSTCTYCDAHPEWQALRIAWGINFTGENDPNKAPCPGSRFRPAEQAAQWHGNRAVRPDGTYEPPPSEPAPRSAFDRIRDNPYEPDDPNRL